MSNDTIPMSSQGQRCRLQNRRASLTFDLTSQGLKFICTASWFDNEKLAEVFLQNCKAGSMAGINAQDAAVVCSIALQYGVPVEVIRRALMRDAQGRASGPLGTALDLIAEGLFEPSSTPEPDLPKPSNEINNLACSAKRSKRRTKSTAYQLPSELRGWQQKNVRFRDNIAEEP